MPYLINVDRPLGQETDHYEAERHTPTGSLSGIGNTARHGLVLTFGMVLIAGEWGIYPLT